MATITTLFDNEGGLNRTYYKAADIIPQALVLTQATYAGSVDGDKPKVVVPYVDTPDDTQVVDEGGTIKESDAAIKEAAITTVKVPQLAVLSNENITEDELLKMVQNALGNAVTDKADALFLAAQAPTERQSGLTGLFNTKNMLDGGTLDAKSGLDPIIKAMGDIGSNNGTPTALIMSPATWARLLTIKLSDGKPLITPDVANTPTPSLYGLPVIQNRQAPTGQILVNSMSEVIAVVSQMTVTGSAERYFERDSFGIRLTMRLGWTVIHPNRLAKITVNTTMA